MSTISPSGFGISGQNPEQINTHFPRLRLKTVPFFPLQSIPTARFRREQRRSAAHPLLTLPVLLAFGLFTSPARAMPAASVQLFRMDGQGVRTLPAVSAVLRAASTPATGSTELRPATSQNADGIEIAQAGGSFSEPKVLELNPDGTLLINTTGEQLSATLNPNNLTINFNIPIPNNLEGPIKVRLINPDGSPSTVQQEITSYTISPDGTQIVLKPSQSLPAGTDYVFEFPTTCGQGTCVYPGQPIGQPLYIGFNPSSLIGPVAVAAAGVPTLAILLGVVAVGVGVAAAAGAFSGGGGSSSNSSSR